MCGFSAKPITEIKKDKPKIKTDDGGIPVPHIQFINISNVSKHVRLSKNELRNGDDVEEYIEALKNAMMDQINANRKITIF